MNNLAAHAKQFNRNEHFFAGHPVEVTVREITDLQHKLAKLCDTTGELMQITCEINRAHDANFALPFGDPRRINCMVLLRDLYTAEIARLSLRRTEALADWHEMMDGFENDAEPADDLHADERELRSGQF
jgi:hypothetical protein